MNIETRERINHTRRREETILQFPLSKETYDKAKMELQKELEQEKLQRQPISTSARYFSH